MTKKLPFDYQCHFRYGQITPSELGSVPAGEFVDEVIPKELVWQRTHQGLALLIYQGHALQALATPDLRLPESPRVEPADSYFLSISDDRRLEKGFYYGLQSLARRYGVKAIENLEFYALEKDTGAYLPLNWQQETFRKGLEKVILESSTEPKTASSLK